MKQGDLRKWTDIPSCNNLLFFSQLVNELLFDYSIPSNRISTLNSHYLCVDAISAIDSIDNHGVPEGTLKPIMEELYASLNKDVTFFLSSETPLSYFVKYDGSKYRISTKVSELNYEELNRIAQALYTRYFSDNWYYESLRTNILEIVKKNRDIDQQNLFRLTKSVLTELINYGYSPMYIYHIMNRLFWNPSTQVSSPDQIQLFFDCFTLKNNKYTVTFVVKKAKILKLSKYVEGIQLHDALEPKSSSHAEKQFLRIRNDEAFLTFENESVDPFQAAEKERDVLETITSYYKLCDHDYRYNISSIPCGVYFADTFTKIGKGVRAVSHIKMPSNKQIVESMKASQNAIDSMVSKRLYRDYMSLSNAVLFHSESLDSKSEKNQLLDFWAIFEAVLDISNKHTADRINQICVYLVPILKRRYIYSLFLQLSNDIKNFSEADYLSIIGTSTSEKDIVRKMCEFTLLEDKLCERESFLLKCNEFPLLKERINYYNQMLNSPTQIYQFVEKHAEQVKWQVMRIYRNRNLIIHNGDSMPYLGLLIENLHSYVDDFLSYAIYALSKGHDLNSMRLELFSKECEWVATFSTKKESLTSETIGVALAL